MNKIGREQADLYQDLFNFLSQEHNLTCTIEEMDEIVHEAQTFVKKFDIANVRGSIFSAQKLKEAYTDGFNDIEFDFNTDYYL